ncbi:MAG: transcription antitermination factor NusB [Prevotellaceae bacterium]|nr:transcription antitermination factor NusB [Prevotellaceae bacterium]
MINRELIRLKVLQLTYAYYQNGDRTVDSTEKELFFSLHKAYDLYMMLLALIVALTKEGARRYEIEKVRAEREGETLEKNKFVANRFAQQLAENETLFNYLEDRSHRWDDDEELIRSLYTQIVASADYRYYMNMGEDSYEEDRNFWRTIYKNIIMDNEDLEEALEGKCIYWNDDKPTIDTFVMKTIKRFDPENGASQPLLNDYSNETEDKEFARKLLRNTINNAEEYQQYMVESAKNWTLDRFAFMDVIIMQMAIAEMLTFPNIPVNITISIYVDMAKLYSTYKSWKFVNGLLDNIAHRLVEERKMLKEVK